MCSKIQWMLPQSYRLLQGYCSTHLFFYCTWNIPLQRAFLHNAVNLFYVWIKNAKKTIKQIANEYNAKCAQWCRLFWPASYSGYLVLAVYEIKFAPVLWDVRVCGTVCWLTASRYHRTAIDAGQSVQWDTVWYSCNNNSFSLGRRCVDFLGAYFCREFSFSSNVIK